MLKRKLLVPIYAATVWVVVDEDIVAQRKRMWRTFGKSTLEDYIGLCESNMDSFGLFFSSRHLTLNLVSHEVFHLVHRIMEWSGCDLDSEHHEQGALLMGWLMEKVWAIVVPD